MYNKFIYQCGLGLLSLTMISFASAQTPTSQQIISWLINVDRSYASPKHDIDLSNTTAFRLSTGEEAYISSVEFGNAGRNFTKGYILTRPKLAQAKILDFGGQSNEFKKHLIAYQGKTYDLIEFESAGSGQGEISRSSTLTYFKNWNTTEITEVNSYSSPGRYDDKLGDTDCKTGGNVTGILNVLDTGYVLQTVVEGNACASKAQDYKISSKLIPIVIK